MNKLRETFLRDATKDFEKIFCELIESPCTRCIHSYEKRINHPGGSYEFELFCDLTNHPSREVCESYECERETK